MLVEVFEKTGKHLLFKASRCNSRAGSLGLWTEISESAWFLAKKTSTFQQPGLLAMALGSNRGGSSFRSHTGHV